jgi:hypothetical protein
MTLRTVLNFFSPNDHGGLDEKQIPVSIEHFIQQPIMLFTITLITMTAFLGIDMLISSEWLIPIGIFQAVTALLLVFYNMGVVFTAVQLSFTYSNMKGLLLQKTSLLFINIPILACYLFIIKTIVF